MTEFDTRLWSATVRRDEITQHKDNVRLVAQYPVYTPDRLDAM